MITGSKELIRDINTNLVLESIINHMAISRAAIAKELGLTKATISAIVQDLINRRLVVEIGSDDTNLGRKPILLSLNRKAGYVICIDLGVESISAIVSDLSGEDISIKKIKTPKNMSNIVQVLIQLVESMKLPHNTPYDLVGITIGIHGVTVNNKVSFAPYYNLTGIPLSAKLEEYFNTSVYLENEANLSVIGEKTFEFDYPNIANISIHSGVGLGIIIQNQLYTGYSGRAGEFGHTIIDVDGRECPCGNRGCLEQYVSERALLKDFANRKGLADISFEYFRSKFMEKDVDAVNVMGSFIKYMSICVNNVLNAYNPDIVIINSSFTNLIENVTGLIEEALSSRMNHYVNIVPSVLQDNSILMGGICVAIKGFLGIKNLQLRHSETPSA